MMKKSVVNGKSESKNQSYCRVARIAFCAVLGFVMLAGAGCGSSPRRIDPAGNEGLITVHGIDFKDWQMAAEKATNSLLESGVLIRADGRKTIVMISEIKNNARSAGAVNTRLLTDRVRQAILRSGKAVTTTAVGAQGSEEKATRQVRELENDDLFNVATVQKRGTVLSPDASLSGEIIQQTRQAGRTRESYFLFHLVLTDLTNGLAVWEDTIELAKQGKDPVF